ncbi:wall-associated receptor kinase-like 14 [Bidens hawaiensis]|uniref:wall-associated receptor kinase-like 14 n=1 Tax=Bidens hawaiensis TaxID=980011 RepID=UPI00404B674C
MFIHLFLVLYAITTSSAASSCNNTHDFPIPYPFGLSNYSKINLTCSNTNQLHLKGYHVLNITRDHILINLPASCNRNVTEFQQLVTENYAPTRRNSLLLDNCNNTFNDCILSPSLIKGHFNEFNCKPMNRSLSCYSDDTSVFMNLTGLMEKVGCRDLYSSITVDLDGRRSSVSMGFQSVELGWWVKGECGCHRKAVCKNVSRDNKRVGYRCHCIDGYDGDGFVEGDGCRRVSNCNASKYMSGECGGTTRVTVLIAGIIIGAFLVSAIALICYCIRKRTNLRKHKSAKRLLSEATGSLNVPFYPYKDISRATNGFSEKQRLGIGAYGTVYAGKLCNNEWVAIKKIRHKETHGINQVMNEIKLLSSVSHPNLVRLLGYCIDKGEQILVYEFMPNGTLSQHLQRERGSGLSWKIRLTIAAETAQAIAYLHSAMNPPIYHRDIKSSNILLDYDYRSKVADFGLSRLGMLDESHVSTAPQGTPGYVDPQYHQNFHLSDKSDVYSFGVVLVELITALKVVDLSRRNSEVNLAALAVDKIGKGRVDEIIDPFLEPNRDAWTTSSIHKVAELAFRCLAYNGDVRPSMTEVADELEQIRVSGWGRVDNYITKDKDSSPVTVQDGWSSEQSSPSTSSL